MRKVLLVALIAFLPYAPASSAEEIDAFPQVLTDPKFIVSQSWRPSGAIEQAVAKWSPYTEKQGFDDKAVLKATKIELVGSVFQAEYRVYRNNPSVEIVFWSGAGDYKSDCSSFLTWATQHFGTPRKAIDMSKPGKQDSYIDVTADWLFGQTRVQVTCGGVKMGEEFIPAIVAVVYRHHTMLKPLEDLVYVECSVTKKYVGSLDKGTTEQGAPLALIIDPNSEKLLRNDKSPLFKTVQYSESEVVAQDSNDERTIVLKLDRVAGSYVMRIRLKKSSDGLDQWGKCERVSNAKKF